MHEAHAHEAARTRKSARPAAQRSARLALSVHRTAELCAELLNALLLGDGIVEAMALGEDLIAALVHEHRERVAHVPGAHLAARHIERGDCQGRARDAIGNSASLLVHVPKRGDDGSIEAAAAAIGCVLHHPR